jgi:hypothetical protein
MPSTASGIIYPSSTDAPDVPASMLAMANSLETILAALPRPSFKQKAAAESLTSNTTLQDDDDIVWALPVGSWRIELFALVAGGAGDVKIAWTWTGTDAGNSCRACIGPGTSSTDVTDGTTRASGHGITSAIGYGTAATGNAYIHEDISMTVVTAGTLQLQWAQNGSSATTTTFQTGTKCYLTPLAVG